MGQFGQPARFMLWRPVVQIHLVLLGQQEVLKILEKIDRDSWISSTNILKKLKCMRSTMIVSLGRMFHYGEIERRKLKYFNHYEFEYRLTDRGRGA